ncbi:MAG: NADH-quinone oxidoreductase subunit N [Planctomycetota bacterium]
MSPADLLSLHLMAPVLWGALAAFILLIILPAGFMPSLFNLVALATTLWMGCRAHGSLHSVHLAGFNQMVIVDPISAFSTLILAVAAFMAFLKAPRYLERTGQSSGEFYFLALCSLSGMILTVSTRHLTGLVMGLEAMSLPLYLLIAGHTRVGRGREAALKYLVLGGASSALMVFGIALLYGESGNLLFPATMWSWQISMGLMGAVFLLAGLLFKIGAFPFQSWVPDVYAHSPTPLVGFMATAVKLAGAVAMLRLLSPYLMQGPLAQAIPLVALATMTVGNFMALAPRPPKEILAYSSVAHTGYALLAFCAPGGAGREALFFYLASYTVMTAGAFAVLSAVPKDDASELRGLMKRRPGLALAFAVCILSLAGIPPLVGFHGKLLVFEAAWASGHSTLVLAAVANSLVALGYYIPLVKLVLFTEPATERDPTSRSARLSLSCLLGAFLVLAFGIFPEWLLGLVPR